MNRFLSVGTLLGLWMIMMNITVLVGVLFPLQGIIIGVFGIALGVYGIVYHIFHPKASHPMYVVNFDDPSQYRPMEATKDRKPPQGGSGTANWRGGPM